MLDQFEITKQFYGFLPSRRDDWWVEMFEHRHMCPVWTQGANLRELHQAFRWNASQNS